MRTMMVSHASARWFAWPSGSPSPIAVVDAAPSRGPVRTASHRSDTLFDRPPMSGLHRPLRYQDVMTSSDAQWRTVRPLTRLASKVDQQIAARRSDAAGQ